MSISLARQASDSDSIEWASLKEEVPKKLPKGT